MGIKCSLLGHRYGETETESEREIRGDEVVITKREYKICSACGSRKLVSESKEVRSNHANTSPDASEEMSTVDQAPSATDRPTSESAGGTMSADPTGQPESTTDTHSGNTEPSVAAGRSDQHRNSGKPETESLSSAAYSSDPDYVSEATEDDAVILNDDSETSSSNAAQKESPGVDLDDTEDSEDLSASPDPSSEYTPWPQQETEDQGFDATAPSEQPTEDVDIGPPEQIEGSLDPAEVDLATEGDPLICPGCGHSDHSSNGSLRRGDICPQCLEEYMVVDEEHNK